MEKNRTSQNEAKRPNVNNSDFDFDNISFKPITKGLGFHHEKERPNTRPFRPSPRPKTFTPTQTIPRPVKEVKLEKVLVTANYQDRILAFMIDFFVILMVTATTLATLVYGANLKIQVLISIISPLELIIFASSIFSLYFLLYFSILDLTSTVGKSLMGLELKLEDGKRPLLASTFPRALVTLISLALLGIPLLSNFQEKFSESEVFKK